jgi:outer membrane lipoprotein-sorting protein
VIPGGNGLKQRGQADKMRKYIQCIIAIALCATPAGAEVPSFDRIIRDYNSIRTISASVKQQVYMPGGEARYFSGDYYADSSGNLRIDYSYPEQETVINNSTGFYWYIPARRTVYVQKGRDSGRSMLNPLPGRIIEGDSSKLKLKYEGIRFYSFFKRAAVWSITSEGSPLVIRVWTDPDGLYVIRKYVLDANGIELVRENYSGHVTVGGVYLPSRVEVLARTPAGVVHSHTEYSGIAVNLTLQRGLFVFKKSRDTAERPLDEM